MKSRLEQLLDELLRQIDIPAMEQAVSEQYKSQIRRRWELPADYWRLLERCCGLRTVWSNDTYEALELWGLDTLVKGLVWESYRAEDGTPLFTARPMNFRAADGTLPQFWADLFDRLGEPVPEGLPGTNPNDMAQEELLEEVHRYF